MKQIKWRCPNAGVEKLAGIQESPRGGPGSPQAFALTFSHTQPKPHAFLNKPSLSLLPLLMLCVWKWVGELVSG